MTSFKQVLVVGGLTTHVYSEPDATPASTPVAVLLLMHGRYGSWKNAEPWVRSIFEWIKDRRAKTQTAAEDLIIVTFVRTYIRTVDHCQSRTTYQDHRNHGSRLVDEAANSAWAESPKNDRHA